MRRKLAALAVASMMVLAVPAAASAKDLIGSGSVAAQPVLEALFAKYQKIHHQNVHFIYTANGGNAGVQDVQQGRSMFAGQARPPLPSDAGTIYIKMYLDGLCIDVNPANSLSNITIPSLRDIFLSNTTDWSDVKGTNRSDTIEPYGRDTNGGTYNFFLQAVLNNHAPGPTVTALTSDGLVVNAVQQHDNGIGYAGLAWQGSGIKSVKVNSIPCSPNKVKSLRYPLSRFIWLVLPQDHPSHDVEKFADWARSSHAAGKVIAKAGGVPAFNKGF